MDEQNLYFRYLKEISRIPLLKRNEEVLLLQKISCGDKAALKHLVSANLRFVIRIAILYRGQGLDLNDLINEGNLGLMEAAVRFDPSKKIKFISYAVFWVRQNIVSALNKHARIVRISAEKELMLRRFRKGGRLKQVVGGTHVVDPKSLEGYSRYNADEVESILQMDIKSISLDSPIDEDSETSLLSMMKSDARDAHELFINRSKKKILSKLLDYYLNPLEKKIIDMYYGFECGAKNDLKDIASMVNMPAQKVSQIKNFAMAKLKTSEELRSFFEG